MNRSFRLLLVTGLALLLLAAGCAAKPAGAPQVARNERAAMPAAAPTQAPAATAAPAMPAEIGSAAASSNLPDEAQRKIILTASLQLVVQETDKTVDRIRSLVSADGGYVVSANIWRDGETIRGNLQVRVPADKIDPFLADVKKLAVRVEREETGGQDVTEEYVDLQARLTNLQAAEKELRELMTSVRQKGGKAEDIMAVYNELVNVRGQIEQIQGRMQYIDRLSAMATVNLDLSEQMAAPIGQPGWQPGQTVRQALNALVQTGKFGVDVLIWVAFYLVPLLIVPVAVIVGVWLLARRRRLRRKLGGS